MAEKIKGSFDGLLSTVPVLALSGVSAAGAVVIVSLSVVGDAKDAPSIIKVLGISIYIAVAVIKFYFSIYIASLLSNLLAREFADEKPWVYSISVSTSAFMLFLFMVASFLFFDLINAMLINTWDVLICESRVKPFYSSATGIPSHPNCKDIDVAIKDIGSWLDSRSKMSGDIADYIFWGFMVYLLVVVELMFVRGFGSEYLYWFDAKGLQGNGDAPITGSCRANSDT